MKIIRTITGNVLSLGLVADDSRPKPNKNTLIIKFKNNMDKNKIIPTLSQTTVMRWVSTDEQLPMCYSTGNWDGKKSDNFIGETITGKQFLGCCYEGTMDGSKFFDWYQVDEINENDWTINETVSRWLPIPF